MANPFDQFDANPFDAFDAPKDRAVRGPVTSAAVKKAVGVKAKPKRGALDEVYGAVTTLNRSIPGMDEAGDGIQAAIDFASGRAGSLPKAWEGARKRSQGASADFKSRRPIVASQVEGVGIAAQIAPALFTGGATAAPTLASAASKKGVVEGAKRLATGPLARSAYAGGAGSAAAGYADEGTLRERLDRGNKAVGPGALLGAGIAAGGKAAAPVVDAVARRFAPAAERSAARAGRILAARVPQVPAEAPTLQPGELPFQSMGRGAKSLARAVANVPGPGQEIAEAAIAAARRDAPGRMLQSLTRDLGDDGSRFYQSLDELDTARKSASRPLYDAFEQEPVFLGDVEEKLAPMLNTRMGRRALASAEALAEAEAVARGVPFRGLGVIIDDQAGTVRFSETPRPQTLDYIKRGFDDALNDFRDPFGKLQPTNEARIMDQFRGEFVRRLDEMFPESYPQARAAYAGPTQQMAAMERGRKLARGGMDAELIERGTERLSVDARDAQALGVARGLSDQFRSGKARSVLRRLNENQVLQDQLRAAFGDDAAYAAFMDDIVREADNFKAYDDILAGSRTTPLREDIDAANAAGNEGFLDHAISAGARRVGGQSFRGQMAGAALQAGERMRSPGIYDETTNRLLAEVLFRGRNPQEVIQAAILQKLITPQDGARLLPLLSRSAALSQQPSPPRLAGSSR